MDSDSVAFLGQSPFARCHLNILQALWACLKVLLWDLSFETPPALQILYSQMV